jgi:damage-control phosphatase, subfamily I
MPSVEQTAIDPRKIARMKTYLDCYPCFLRQALSAARRAGATTDQQKQILLDTMDALRSLPSDATPPVMAEGIHQLVRARTSNPDPYREAKQEATEQALALLPGLMDQVRKAADPLETAVRIAIAGNIIDYGVAESYELEATLQRVLEKPFAIDDLPFLREALDRADSVLYLADNAGETVFDQVLIQVIDRPVTYVVKAGPIINDATYEDALAAGLAEVAEIVDNGSDAPGTLMDRCSADFRRRFEQASLIIAKGQANYETLSASQAPLFFLLQAKCAIIARDLGVTPGSTVVKGPRGRT